jgi:hypothetical protein
VMADTGHGQAAGTGGGWRSSLRRRPCAGAYVSGP